MHTHAKAEARETDFYPIIMKKSPHLNVTALFRQAHAMQQQNRAADAEKIYRKILAAHKNHFDSLHMLGILCAQTNRLEEAAELISEAVQINPNNPATHNNLGNIFQYLKKYEIAIESFNKAIQLNPEYTHAFFNLGNAQMEIGRLESAISSYEEAILRSPEFVEAYIRHGRALRQINQLPASIQSYQRANIFKPNDTEILATLGALYLDTQQPKEAIDYLKKAIATNPLNAILYLNRGNAYELLKSYDLAHQDYYTAWKLNAELDTLYETKLLCELHMCDWSNLSNGLEYIEKKLMDNSKCAFPFLSLAVSNNPEVQKKLAEKHTIENFSPPAHISSDWPKKNSNIIRIGYFSADFKIHPVTSLISELFEIHDRKKFEVFAFSLGPQIIDSARQRIAAGVDHFIDAGLMTDLEIVNLARSRGIDIAIDLGGFTQNSRTGIFLHRVAPIQASYLGYAGTMGATFIDYLIADKFTIPSQYKQNYSEKIAFLPHTFQVNDSHREISSRQFSRQDFNLPENSFIFCCFNKSYKITPTTFDLWMRILSRTPNSVLWLKTDNSISEINLTKEAAQRGIDPRRLIFTGPMPLLSEHLARHRLADLFLDTFPYNAHTTASDALWTGLPVLTRAGETFASRVAGSLLHAINLPELITYSENEYENKAVAFAQQPDLIKNTRNKLNSNKSNTPLFNTELFAHHIERCYETMYQIHHSGGTIDHIYVEEKLLY